MSFEALSLLLFGQTGQVARELATWAPQACAAATCDASPAAVINAAAYTAVDKAEDEEALATTINGVTPAVLPQACAALGVPFIQITTDYVDGSGKVPRRPDWRDRLHEILRDLGAVEAG